MRSAESDEEAGGGTVAVSGNALRKWEQAREFALGLPGAEPAGYGLGRAGWVRVPLAEQGAPAAGLLCDWVEESCRAITPKRLIAEIAER
ncbi:hypothetical protein M2164_001708 [Streptomyces sp. SAI-208]|nr:hypothetical protein [Streptomyces sp. SAI-090]MDH6588534.1 hypothetical protein [Streptomyces sp. SAI-133]MDH6606073.1 hypothetical protein [Streptomyces sp. SAI-208]MDH6620687.1 hypothetical protein [Streptomyces sp. SAI-135]